MKVTDKKKLQEVLNTLEDQLSIINESTTIDDIEVHSPSDIYNNLNNVIGELIDLIGNGVN